MTNNQHQESILEQVDALLEIHVSAESTQRALQQTEQLLLSLVDEQSPDVRRHSFRRRTSSRIAYVLVALCLIVAVSLLFQGDANRLVFAQVQEKLDRVQTVTYTSVVLDEGKELSAKWMHAGTRTRREESNGDVYVSNPDELISMHMDVSEKLVVIRHRSAEKFERLRKTESLGLYERLKTLHHNSAKRVGELRVNGKETVGFIVVEPGNRQEMTVWVDKRTHLPVRIDATGSRLSKDFAFDVSLKDELFEITVPDGFRIDHRYDEPQPPAKFTERELAKLLTLVKDTRRSALQTGDLFLRLAQSGCDADAKGLGHNLAEKDAESIRKLHEFRKLKIDGCYPGSTVALVVTSEFSYRAREHRLFFELKNEDDQWTIADIDLVSKDHLDEVKARFFAKHPDVVKTP
ncbi:MAG: hypothetical protein O3B13_12275 [Planctomycetota bacterium]|nr:hypothetical protein [Planctomycetota bacterium]MDA1163871.1 hypothetical protein [Planctomycetota bacterium]